MIRCGKLGLCFAVLAAGLCSSTNAQVVPKAQSRTMRLDQSGAGLWAQAGSPDLKLLHVTVGGNPARNIGIEFFLEGGGRRSLSGVIERKEADSLRVKLTGFGTVHASGVMLIEDAPGNSISVLFGMGLIDGQPFGVQFSRSVPLQLDLSAIGAGTWAASGSPDSAIQRMSLLSDTRGKAEAAFFLVDGRIRRISGHAKQGPGQSLVVDLSTEGMADASGELVVCFDKKTGRKPEKKNQIVSVEGNVRIDGRAVGLKFESADPNLPVQASMIDATLAGLKKVDGKWTQGDATTTYSGYVDDAWVRRIDATLDQGDFGSSQRRMYFTREQLYYTESAERRERSPSGQGKLSKLDLRLTFDAQGKLLESRKTLNGSSSKVGESEIAGAKVYAEALRKEVEENISQSLPSIDERLP